MSECSGDVYLCIEGGAGVAEEAQAAFDNGTSMAKKFKSTLNGCLHLRFRLWEFSGLGFRAAFHGLQTERFELKGSCVAFRLGASWSFVCHANFVEVRIRRSIRA